MNVIIQLFVYDFAQCKTHYEAMRKELRLQEQCHCLARNLMDPSIKSVHIFVDTPQAKHLYSQVAESFQGKAIFNEHGRQPTYKELVEYAARTFQDGELVCIMNSDIYFNSQKDHHLIQKIAKPKRLISLTRHEYTDHEHTICNLDTCNFTGNGGSSDVFIFTMPIDRNFPYDTIDHKQNLFGAEAVFHKAWVDCGYELSNPCDDIKTIHLHKDRIHFDAYKHVETPENSAMNWKTPLPPEAFT